MKTTLVSTTILLLAAASSLAADAPGLTKAFSDHCVKCHGQDGEIEGEVDLVKMKTSADLQSHPELLEDLVAVLKDREMPPEDEPALPDDRRNRMIEQLEEIFKESLKNQPFEPTPIRRMNRFQYNNAVVDLLESDRDIFQLNERLMRRREDYFRPETKKMPDKVRVSSRPLSKDIDNQRPEGFRGVAPFPQDQRAEHGFDNRADHLSLSPLLMESFLQLSESIALSPDLNQKECHCWDWLFAEPKSEDVDKTEFVHSGIKRLLLRAFRRPVDPETYDRFAQFADEQLASGATVEKTMRTIVGAAIGMPDFLYLYDNRASNEESRPGIAGRERIDDFELASRLAQFFWSSIPDDTLLELAEKGELNKSEVLGEQIDRMMNDKRSSRFCDNFPSQWLQLDRLITAIPDTEKYAYFYYDGYRTSMHMMSEPLLLFETVFIEDRPIIELIDPDFTWQSDMLRANYEGNADGDTQVQVQDFKRVPLDDPRRGGVITNAAIMTMTSTPTRTQPITRGAWVNAVIFNDPPHPPPADVPPLPEVDAEELEKLTIRERLAVHRERADCAGCHDKIDPLGFALENYGPTGVWRDKYENGRDVDVSGVLFNQHEFDTALKFKKLIVQEKQRFIRAFAAHLLSYGLGRELGPADSPTLDGISTKAMAGDDTLRSILKQVAMSEPFLHKNIQSAQADGARTSEARK